MQGVSPLDFPESQVPKCQIARVVSLRFLGASTLQISNRKGCFPRFFRYSGPQISNRKGSPPKIFQRIGCPPRFFLSESFPRFSSVFLDLLYFGRRRHLNIISIRFKLNCTCGVLRPFNCLFFLHVRCQWTGPRPSTGSAWLTG